MDGNSTKGWRVVAGKAQSRNGAIQLTPLVGKKATMLAEGVQLKNGTVEVTIAHPAGCDDPGPYTVGLRSKWSLQWSSIYCVCRPDHLELCRGSSSDNQPAAQAVAHYARSSRPEQWRFVMTDGKIDCYRFGRKVLTYDDVGPNEGTIAITTDGCDLEILAARYLPAD